VIAKLTAHKMEDRYESARHVATDLVKLLATCAPLPNGERGVRARTAHMMQRLYPSEPAKSRAEFDSLVKAARWAGGEDSPSAPVASGEVVKSPIPGAAPVMQMQVQTPPRSPLPPPRSPLQSITDGDPNVLVGTRYRILGTIGSGAMGTVYEAQHVDLLRRVALKVLSQDRAMITDVAAFRREAQAIANVLHPNLVMIHDFGESADGRPYCAMELLDGETLEQRLIQDTRLDWREAAKIGILACRGLEAAHAVGVVHCDLKPANLFLTKGPAGEVGLRGRHAGELKILDFGIAHRASEVHTPSESEGAFAMTGTPEYMAPEQARSGTVDARADVYALGCVLYELCTGRRPFVAGSPVELVEMKRKAAPESMRVRSRALGLPACLDRIVLRALAPNPRDRQASAEELRLELEQVLGAPRRRRVASHWIGYASIAGAGLFALSAFGVMQWIPGGAGARFRQALVSAVGNRAVGAVTELGGRAIHVLDAAKAVPIESRVVNLDDPAESEPPAPVAADGDHPANRAAPPAAPTMGNGVTAGPRAERTSTDALANPEARGTAPRDHAGTSLAEGAAKPGPTTLGNATPKIRSAVAADGTANGGHGASGDSVTNGSRATGDAFKPNGAAAGSAVAPSTSPKSEVASLPAALPGSADPVTTGLGAGAAALEDGFASQALLIHRDLAERHPRDTRVLRAYAESAAAAQEWKEAAMAAENWSLADSGVEPRLFYVRMLAYGGKPRAARRMLEDILEAHPECDEARALMADYRANAGPAPKPVNVRADRSQTNGSRGEVGARP
jgi:serine/threonine-protein kinase